MPALRETADSAGISRRSFLKICGALASAAAAGSAWFVPSTAHAATYGTPIPPDGTAGTQSLNTVCLMCHSACGLKALVNSEGRLIKMDANPYHPHGSDFPVDYNTDLNAVATGEQGQNGPARHLRARCCAKAQAAIETLYSPTRLRHPLKRVGPRGSGQWETISWDQAFTEIADRLRPLRDFSTPIVPGDTADSSTVFGTRVNGVVFSGGRNQPGQADFTDRFWGKCFGTVNKRHDHTSICEVSHHMAFKYLTNENGASGGVTKMNADYRSAEYVIMFGFSPFEANFPMVPLSRKVVNMITGERGAGVDNDGVPGRYVIIDPRFSNAASKAHKWLPVKPGTDAALALAMGRHMIQNGLIQTAFLKRPAKSAPNTTNETCVSDATWLVNLESRDYLKPTEVDGLTEGTDVYGKDKVVIPEGGGAPATADSVSAGELFYVGTVPRAGGGDPIPVKTVLQMYNDVTYGSDPYAPAGNPPQSGAAHSAAMDQWSSVCGIPRADIEQVAGEFGQVGVTNRRCFAEHYRGAVQHTNGTFTGMTINYLNWLVGNVDFRGGGIIGGGHFHSDGSAATNLYPKSDMADVAGKDPLSDKGVMITRTGKAFSAEHAALLGESLNAPTRRPWFPFAQNFNYQEILPSILDQYPYGCSALFLYWNNCAYSTPAHKEIARRVLTDETKVPLLVCIDIEFGETSVFADYLLPDTTFMERWSQPHVASTMPTLFSGVRRPVVGSINGIPVHQLSAMPAQATYTPLHPDTRMLEDILIGIGKKLNLPGVGDNAFTVGFAGDSNDTGLHTAWDYHKRLIGNIAAEAGPGPVPGGGGPSGGGALNTNLDAVNYVLERGGRFGKAADQTGGNDEYDADGIHMKKKFGKLLQFYVPAFAKTSNSMKPGEKFSGIAVYEPPRGVKGSLIVESAQYPFKLITYKPAFHAQARTICNPSLLSLQPVNHIEISPEDAAALGLQDGFWAKVVSRTNPGGLTGRVRIRPLRPGVVAICHSYGHWEMGSRSHTIDGSPSPNVVERGAGLQATLLMDTDPDNNNSVCYQDLIGGSASFYDTPVNVIKL
ncbi:MAG: tetrathionate reductase subunit A [Candidatus Sumerlaeia bacterium]